MQPGIETTFKVYIPVSGKPHIEKKIGNDITTRLRGSETILLVEDNEQVRALAKAVLKRQGYSVLVAEKGPEAFTILEAYDDPVQLLLTDVIMPEMNGKELFNILVERHPGLKVLYMSGYTDNTITSGGMLDKGVIFIQKPFNVQTLAVKVREMLDKSQEV